MRREVPGGRAAHGEAAHDDAILVDGVALLDALQRFEEVDFSRELAGVAEAAIKVADNRVGGSEFARRLQAALEKTQFGERLVAAMQPEIQAMLVGPGSHYLAKAATSYQAEVYVARPEGRER